MKLKESHIDGKGKNYIKDVDKSGKDNNDLCDELTINSVKELRRKMRGMDISKKDKVKINNYIKEMNKTNKKLSVDLDVNNTYLRYIQNMLCTYSSEDKNNIDEMKVIRLKESDIHRIVKRVLREQSILGNFTRTLADPSNVGPSFDIDQGGLSPDPLTTAAEKVWELFEKAKKEFGNRLLPQETLNRLESDAKKLKAAMDGAGINGTEVKRILNRIKDKDELNNLLIFFECGDLNSNKDCGKSLYNWLAGEYTISWDTIWKSLESRFDKDVYHGGKYTS